MKCKVINISRIKKKNLRKLFFYKTQKITDLLKKINSIIPFL